MEERFKIKIEAIASSSSGNCYIINGYKTKLMIECGIPFKTLFRKLNGDLCSIDGCLVTHHHQDHAKSLYDVASKGVPVYATKETFGYFKFHHNYKLLNPVRNKNGAPIYSRNRIGEFLVQPFHVEHSNHNGKGDIKSVGFIIDSGVSRERVLFITDTYYSRYNFPDVTHYMIEANYSESIIRESDEHKAYIDRLWTSHFSIERVCKFMQAQIDKGYFSKGVKIYLMHLSTKNSDEKLFKQLIKNVTGIEPVIFK